MTRLLCAGISPRHRCLVCWVRQTRSFFLSHAVFMPSRRDHAQVLPRSQRAAAPASLLRGGQPREMEHPTGLHQRLSGARPLNPSSFIFENI